jgi:hypothetical protein
MLGCTVGVAGDGVVTVEVLDRSQNVKVDDARVTADDPPGVDVAFGLMNERMWVCRCRPTTLPGSRRMTSDQPPFQKCIGRNDFPGPVGIHGRFDVSRLSSVEPFFADRIVGMLVIGLVLSEMGEGFTSRTPT